MINILLLLIGTLDPNVNVYLKNVNVKIKQGENMFPIEI